MKIEKLKCKIHENRKFTEHMFFKKIKYADNNLRCSCTRFNQST